MTYAPEPDTAFLGSGSGRVSFSIAFEFFKADFVGGVGGEEERARLMTHEKCLGGQRRV